MHSLLSLSVLALSSAGVVLGQLPQKPSVDPFYQPPNGFANTPRGTVLAQRSITPGNLGLAGLANLQVSAKQLLYHTRAISNASIATVTTVYIPNNIARAGQFLSYQIPEDAAFIDCAPSYGLQLGSASGDPNISPSGNQISQYLQQGYVVAVPDYEGPDAAFATRLEGYGVLDGMRAVNNYLGGNNAIVGAGYSGGAIATGWAASLAGGYAPELNIKGWTIGGTPANLTATVIFQDTSNNGLFAGFATIALTGLNKQSSYYAGLNGKLQSILTSTGKTLVNNAGSNQCVFEPLIAFAATVKSIFSTSFTTLGASVLNDPVIKFILAYCTLGAFSNENPTAPVLLYHAQGDNVTPYSAAQALNSAWCAQGTNVQFTTVTSGDHFSAESDAFPLALFYANYFLSGGGISQCQTNSIVS